jgi:hypothetical protein
MSLRTPRRRHAALLAALALVAPALSGVAGASDAPGEVPEHSGDGAPPEAVLDDLDPLEGLGDPSDGGETDVRPARPVPDVPGVELARLGYDGIPLDADVIDRATAPLPDDPRERVVEISERLESLPPQLEGLEAAEERLQVAVERLDAHVRTRQGALAVATLRAEDADRRVGDARIRARDRSALLVDHRTQMAEVAIAAYVRPPDADALSQVLGGAAQTTEGLTAPVLFSAKADHDGAVRDELELARAVAAERLDLAEATQDATRQRLSSAEASLARAEDRQVAHRRALAIVSAARTTVEDALPDLQADLDRTIEETWPIEALAAGTTDDAGAIVRVAGIAVHAAIAPRVQALIAAAHSAGVPLGGWGYRSTAQQIELRRAHCGPTPEDVWLKPSSQCSPPTARPGASMHERGLAIDFHLAGRSISTRESPGYQWLAANAATYGLYNLPSEPWHWSVNAQ